MTWWFSVTHLKKKKHFLLVYSFLLFKLTLKNKISHQSSLENVATYRRLDKKRNVTLHNQIYNTIFTKLQVKASIKSKWEWEL